MVAVRIHFRIQMARLCYGQRKIRQGARRPEGYAALQPLSPTLREIPTAAPNPPIIPKNQQPFIDGEAPYVKEIAIVSRNMNNDDIKKELAP